MTLTEDLDDTYRQLAAYDKSHPNLVRAWKRRLADDVGAVYKTIHSTDIAIAMFQKYPDMSLDMMALIHAFFRVCRPAFPKPPPPSAVGEAHSPSAAFAEPPMACACGLRTEGCRHVCLRQGLGGETTGGYANAAAANGSCSEAALSPYAETPPPSDDEDGWVAEGTANLI